MIKIIKQKIVLSGLLVSLLMGTSIGIALSLTVLISDDSSQSVSVGTRFMLVTGNSAIPAGNTEMRVFVSEGQLWEEMLPLTLSEAKNLRWKKDVQCVPNVGYYSRRAAANDLPEPYSLIFDNNDKVIGMYLFSENQQQSPWEQIQATGPFPYPHWGLHIFFQDSAKACL